MSQTHEQKRKSTPPKPKSKANTPLPKKFENINKSIIYKKENLTLGLINTRSIKSDEKGASLEDYINDTKYQVYAITETWLPAAADKGDPSWGPSIHNYSNLASRGRENKTGGGVT